MKLYGRFGALFFILLVYSSCKKELGPCTGNCKLVEFTGVAFDPGAKKPLAHLTVTVYMSRRQACTFCGPYEIASGKTGADGTFKLTTSVDTTLVYAEYCRILVNGPAHYITYAEPVGPGFQPDPNVNSIELQPSLDPTGAAPFEEYDFFQAVPLTLQLHRTGGIVSSDPSLGLNFTVGASSLSAWGLDESASNIDTALTVLTGANVFTKVEYIQFVTDSTSVRQTDSILCVPGGNNTIVINYP